MGGKYQIRAGQYEGKAWEVVVYTNSIFKAVKMWIYSLLKYELVEFVIRK